jgi:hypothetical protein
MRSVPGSGHDHRARGKPGCISRPISYLSIAVTRKWRPRRGRGAGREPGTAPPPHFSSTAPTSAGFGPTVTDGRHPFPDLATPAPGKQIAEAVQRA